MKERVSGEKGEEEEGDTVTEDAAKKVLKERGFCVDEVVVEDMLNCTNVGGHDTVILQMWCHRQGEWRERSGRRTLKKALNLKV